MAFDLTTSHGITLSAFEHVDPAVMSILMDSNCVDWLDDAFSEDMLAACRDSAMQWIEFYGVAVSSETYSLLVDHMVAHCRAWAIHCS